MISKNTINVIYPTYLFLHWICNSYYYIKCLNFMTISYYFNKATITKEKIIKTVSNLIMEIYVSFFVVITILFYLKSKINFSNKKLKKHIYSILLIKKLTFKDCF